jgi:hypothetical protein
MQFKIMVRTNQRSDAVFHLSRTIHKILAIFGKPEMAETPFLVLGIDTGQK